MNLILPLKKKYFDQIKAGTKPYEYRLRTPYWIKRIECKSFNNVVFTLGYPRRDDAERRIVRAWMGYENRTITHDEFGPHPVQVIAIAVAQDRI